MGETKECVVFYTDAGKTSIAIGKLSTIAKELNDKGQAILKISFERSAIEQARRTLLSQSVA